MRDSPCISCTAKGCHMMCHKWKMWFSAEWAKIREATDKMVDTVSVIRCSECKWRGDTACPMYHEEYVEWDDDGYHESEYIPHDRTVEDGYCQYGERRSDD